jgi:hypothetical protein
MIRAPLVRSKFGQPIRTGRTCAGPAADAEKIREFSTPK